MTPPTPPTPPPGMPGFEAPPTQAAPTPPTASAPPPSAGPAAPHRPSRATDANPFARRPWVATAGAAGLVVVAAAAGYGLGRQADPLPASTDGTTAVVSGTGGSTDRGTASGEPQLDPGTGLDPFSGQFQPPGSGSGQAPSDPEGFGGQPGTVTPGPGQAGPSTSSGGS